MPGCAVAKFKTSIKQNDFSLGEVRPEFLESDGNEIRTRSLKEARNVRLISGTVMRERFGTYKKTSLGSYNENPVFPLPKPWHKTLEIEPIEGVKFLLVFESGMLRVYDTSGTIVTTFSASIPWTVAPWVVPARENTYIGSFAHEIYVLNYDGSTWTLGVMAYDESPGGHIAQPYWTFNKGVTLTPSALTGTGITLTASSPVFTADYVGLRLRYHGKEIDITGYTSTTVLTGDVISDLPPSFDITLNNAKGFETGHVVTGVNSGYSGYVVAVNTSTNVVSVVTLEGFEGPDTAPYEELASPTSTSLITAVAAAGSPYASPRWDEPLLSDIHGYPRAATFLGGRLYLTDFPDVPDLIAGSSVRSPQDFEIGLDDDDAILRTVGNGNLRVRHLIDAGDLIVLSDEGAYYVAARGGVPITPTNFNTIKIDTRGANSVEPVLADDAVVFVSETGEDVLAAVLDGNIYLKWTVLTISKNHAHLVDSPAFLCAPPKTIKDENRFILVGNEDGTVIAAQWDRRVGAVGISLWDNATETVDLVPPKTGQTTGWFHYIAPFNGAYWAVASRAFDGGNAERYLEVFSHDAWMDFSEDHVGASSPSLSHYEGARITARIGNNIIGEYDDYADVETLISGGDAADTYQIGVAFESYIIPWPVEYVNSQRLGMIRSRTIRVGVSVRDTLAFYVRRNNITSRVEPYSFGDDLSAPPPTKTKVYRFPVLGNRDHPEIVIGSDAPGPFEVSAYIAEVQG